MIIDADPLVVFVVTMLANSGDGGQIKLAEKSARRVLRNIPAVLRRNSMSRERADVLGGRRQRRV